MRALSVSHSSSADAFVVVTRTGWDMDPFVVLSFGKKVFRTRVIRHSRNPVWDEKLLFHVRRYETSFKVQLTILDWDKLSSNDYVGDARFDVKELVDSAPQPDPETGLYPLDQEEHSMKEYNIPLTTDKGVPWEKHHPTIKFRCVATLCSLSGVLLTISSAPSTNLMQPFVNGSGIST